jgi:hypothetical protein
MHNVMVSAYPVVAHVVDLMESPLCKKISQKRMFHGSWWSDGVSRACIFCIKKDNAGVLKSRAWAE